MNRSFSKIARVSVLSAMVCTLPSASWALDQIIRPYQSVRSEAMGGVKITTGLYDENFFGNPARITANPHNRFSLIDLTAEVDSSAISHISDLVSPGDGVVSKVADTAGSNNHVRLQLSLPSFFIAPGEEGRWAFGFGLFLVQQTDFIIRQSYQISPQTVIDVGPAFSVGRKFMADKQLSVGATLHVDFRGSLKPDYSMLDFLQTSTFAISKIGAVGYTVDGDLGATYLLPWKWLSMDWTVGASINNLADGHYTNISVGSLNSGLTPPNQSRSLGMGVSAKLADWHTFHDTTFALEFTDIGNNPNGSLYRLIHLGTETHIGIFVPRLGLNQGYIAAGLGLDFRHFELDVATYGEEMSLIAGGNQDRRYALHLSLPI